MTFSKKKSAGGHQLGAARIAATFRITYFERNRVAAPTSCECGIAADKFDFRDSSKGFVPALRTRKICCSSSPAKTSPKSRVVISITTTGPSSPAAAPACEVKQETSASNDSANDAIRAALDAVMSLRV